MFQNRCGVPILLFALLIATGCAPEATATPSETPEPLRPYATVTRTPLQTPSATPQLYFPSPTPLTYTVVQGDTLTGISQKYGVSLADLLAANPGITATTLMVGTVVIIPTAPISTPVAGPTPVPLPFTHVDCWPSAERGMWCFAAITNSTGDTLENLIAQISLLGSNGETIATQTAMSMLDILHPGRSTALASYFPAPIPPGILPQAKLISAVRILPYDARYAPVTTENLLVNVDWSGLTAQVSGQAVPVAGQSVPEIPAGQLWIAATAYDSQGRVVGVRRWESESPLPAGGRLPFNFLISSMGPPIDKVEILVEARPPAIQTTP